LDVIFEFAADKQQALDRLRRGKPAPLES
jgi:hypothetical protein